MHKHDLALPTVSGRFVNTSSLKLGEGVGGDKRRWPRCPLWKKKKKRSQCFWFLLAIPLLYPPATTACPSHPFQSDVWKKHGILQHLRFWSRVVGRRGGAVGCSTQSGWLKAFRRLRCTTFLLLLPFADAFYKQVSNVPDLVWQTFSKDHLKKGWESDTHTRASHPPSFSLFLLFFFFLFSFLHRQKKKKKKSGLRLLLLFFDHCHLFLPFAVNSFLLHPDGSPVVPLDCRRNGGKSRGKKRDERARVLKGFCQECLVDVCCTAKCKFSNEGEQLTGCFVVLWHTRTQAHTHTGTHTQARTHVYWL